MHFIWGITAADRKYLAGLIAEFDGSGGGKEAGQKILQPPFSDFSKDAGVGTGRPCLAFQLPTGYFPAWESKIHLIIL